MKETNYIYTYRIQSFGRNIHELGNRFLGFWVKDGIITKIWIEENDG